MASTLEMLIRAKYTSVGSDAMLNELKQIKSLVADLGKQTVQAPKIEKIKFNPDDFGFSQSDIDVVKTRIGELSSEVTKYKQASMAAFAEGNIEAQKQFSATATAVEGEQKALEKLVPQIEKTDFATQLLNSKMAKLGFGIFAVQSSIQTFTSLIKGMFAALSEGAGSLDRSRSFEMLLSGEGIDSDRMAQKLKIASQGLLTLDQAMAKTIQLTKAGFPEMAENSDKLLQIATNAAIVSGDVNSAAVVYDKLIRGIIRGSPRLIDDADIILKLGDANEQYAASLGKTVEQLTAADKVQATYNAVLQEGSRINQLAETMDSTSAKVQKLNTDWQEFTESLKESAAIILISDAEIEKIEKMPIMLRTIANATAEQDAELTERLTTSLKGWGVLVAGAFVRIIESVKSFFSVMKSGTDIIVETAKVAGMQVLKLGFSFEALALSISGNKKEADAVRQKIDLLTMEGVKSAGVMSDAFGNIFSAGDFEKNYTNKMDQILEAGGFISGKSRQGVSPDGAITEDGDGTGEAEAVEEETVNVQKLLQERAKMQEDIAYERTQKIQDINRDHTDKMRDIARKLSDKLSDIDRDLRDKLVDIAQNRADKLADINEGLAEKIAETNEDLADKLADIIDDANEKRADAQDDYNKAIEDAEEDHQDKINDILRKYESSRLKALIDRDARALFEAGKARDEDLADLEDSSEDKKQEELEKLQEKLDDINKAEEKQRADAIKNAEERRQDAIQAADRARRDAQEAYARSLRDAQQAADRARQDARAAAIQEREDALRDQQSKRADLQSWYQDKLRDLAAFHQEELGAYAQQYSNINDATANFMSAQLAQHADFVHAMGSMYSWTGVGSTTDPGTGQEFPDWHNPANVYSGGRCNRGSSQVTTGADGRQYVCQGNTWQLLSTGAAGANFMATGGGIPLQGAGGGQFSSTTGERMKIVIEGNGDDALNKIIKSGAYEAFMEVVR